jgi:Eukaryotic porin
MSVPTTFGKYGSNMKDLVSKNLKFDDKLVSKTKTANGTEIESTITALSGDAASFTGAVKATTNINQVGKVEATFGTDGTTKGSVKNTTLVDGLTLKLSGTDSDKETSAAVNAEYSQDSFIGSVEVQHVTKAGKGQTIGDNINLAASAGLDGLAVGGELKYNTTSAQVVEYNAGFEYSADGFTGGIKSTNNNSVIQADLFHLYSSSISYGISATYGTKDHARDFTIAASNQIDDNTYVKIVGNTGSSTVTASWQQNLPASGFQYAIAAAFDASKLSSTPTETGFRIQIGDSAKFE